MVKVSENKIMFALSAGDEPEAPLTIIIGIPKGSWEYMGEFVWDGTDEKVGT
jgi:hypothetical protein